MDLCAHHDALLLSGTGAWRCAAPGGFNSMVICRSSGSWTCLAAVRAPQASNARPIGRTSSVRPESGTPCGCSNINSTVVKSCRKLSAGTETIHLGRAPPGMALSPVRVVGRTTDAMRSAAHRIGAHCPLDHYGGREDAPPVHGTSPPPPIYEMRGPPNAQAKRPGRPEPLLQCPLP